ncbi:argonaute/piwi family protein [Sporobolomyces salmoneus]|uniref:argonaute/piwi family protein n=1 Tax=Sporobolomyces salmoneus TaxID=183962 RepID=UPI00317591A8
MSMPPRRGPPPPPPPPPPAPAPGPTSGQTPAQTPETHVATRPAPSARSDEVLEPMSRPGVGRKGRRILGIRANTFKVKLPEGENIWWKYEIVIATAARVRSDGSTAPSKPLPKSLLWKVWREIETTHVASFAGLRPAYDGGNVVYSNRQLPSSPLIASLRFRIDGITLPDGRRGTFTATIKNPISIPLDSLQSYISGQGQAHVGDVFEALQALNVLFRHTPSLLFSSTRTSFFPMDNQGASVRLPKGIQLWRGFFQSIRPCALGLQLNLDTTSGAYVQTGNLMDLVLSITNLRDPRMLDVSHGRLDGTTIVYTNRLLRKVRVTVDRGRQVPAGKDRYLKMELKGSGLKFLSARTHTFEVEGRVVSVEDFFRDTYGTRLQHPDIPLLEVKRGVLVPMELVTVDPGNKWTHRLSPEQTKLAASFQILEPGDRLHQILRQRHGSMQQQQLAHLRSFGVTVANNETQVPARVLPPPRIEYQAERPRDRRQGGQPRFVTARVNDGGWKHIKSGQDVTEKFITPGRELESAIVILARPNMQRDAPVFLRNFFENCENLGVLVSRTVATIDNGLFLAKNHDDVAQVIMTGLRQAQNVFGKPPQIVFWLFESENSEDYDKFKFETLRRGIASQALVHKKLSNKTNDFTFHLNCALKINVKLSGFNFRLERPDSPPYNFMQTMAPMVFGADLSHQQDKPSIAVVTASMHEQGVLHEEQITIQPLLEPGPGAPPTARAKKQETIVYLEQMVFDLLCRRILSQPRCPPVSIVFFRDGVSEAEISQVLRTEVASARRAFDRFRQTLLDPTSAEHREFVGSVRNKARMSDDAKQACIDEFLGRLKEWNPKLTFILTIKRHHLRAFAENGQNVQNISPGTVIDTHIVDARAFDFYLASHKGIKGTTRATRYLVLVDENNLSADDVQEFANDSAHMFQRCTRAVSLPASVYYADVIGRRVRGWLNANGGNYDASTEHSYSAIPTAQTRRADLEACRLTLEETVVGRNMFRAQGGPPAMWWL